MKLNIPYYSQKTNFTCDSACIMMVLKYFRPRLHLSKSLELRIFRESNLVTVKGCPPQALALYAIRQRLKTFLICRKEGIFQTTAIKKSDKMTAEYISKEFFSDARKGGMKTLYKKPTLADIKKAIESNKIPIVMIYGKRIHGFDDLHYVVVSGITKEHVFINDPFPKTGKKDLKLDLTDFEKALTEVRTKFGVHERILIVGRNY